MTRILHHEISIASSTHISNDHEISILMRVKLPQQALNMLVFVISSRKHYILLYTFTLHMYCIYMYNTCIYYTCIVLKH